MQDWNYFYTNDLELTIEQGCIKYPMGGTLKSYWDDNKYAYLTYIAQVCTHWKTLLCALGSYCLLDSPLCESGIGTASETLMFLIRKSWGNSVRMSRCSLLWYLHSAFAYIRSHQCRPADIKNTTFTCHKPRRTPCINPLLYYWKAEVIIGKQFMWNWVQSKICFKDLL